MFLGSISIHRAHLDKLAINDIFSLASSGWLRLSCAYRSRMPVGALFLVAQFVVIRTESTATKATRIRFLTCNSKQKKPSKYLAWQFFNISMLTRVDSHVAIPSRSIVQRFTANWALLPLFGIAHARRCNLLHVIIQLKLLKRKIQLGQTIRNLKIGVWALHLHLPWLLLD